jgi:hypothetical protein
MTSKLLTNAQYWRERDEEIKAIADRQVSLAHLLCWPDGEKWLTLV